MNDKTFNEKEIDELKQIVFRIETNLVPIRKKRGMDDIIYDCLLAIEDDLESLKQKISYERP